MSRLGRPPREQPNERELDILSWLAGGATNALIATEMEMTEPAVKTAIRVMRLRVGALTVAHLVSIAHIKGWLDTPCNRPHVPPAPCGEASGVEFMNPCVLERGHTGEHFRRGMVL